MTTKIESCTLRDKVTFCYSQSMLSVYGSNLFLVTLTEKVIECHLTIQINLEQYRHIDKKALFNLRPEVRGTLTGEFISESPIQLEVSLKPDLLRHLAGDPTNIEKFAACFLNLNQEEPEHICWLTENWLALSVQQIQESGEVGYRTFWSYVCPSVLTQKTASTEDISGAISNFFNDWTQANLNTITQKATSDLLGGMTSLFQELSEEMSGAMAEEMRASSSPTSTNQPIFEAIIGFFRSEGWEFARVEGKTVLQIAFRGKSGTWSCYARAREEEQQFIFYSICPIAAPEDKRQAIAEFLTRANYGMTIGNFELDYTDGEIRYKTSIDVEGERLTSALIRSIVYTNVTMMDAYLPGIQAVIHQRISPIEAIRSIEQVDQTQDNQANPK